MSSCRACVGPSSTGSERPGVPCSIGAEEPAPVREDDPPLEEPSPEDPVPPTVAQAPAGPAVFARAEGADTKIKPVAATAATGTRNGRLRGIAESVTRHGSTVRFRGRNAEVRGKGDEEFSWYSTRVRRRRLR